MSRRCMTARRARRCCDISSIPSSARSSCVHCWVTAPACSVRLCLPGSDESRKSVHQSDCADEIAPTRWPDRPVGGGVAGTYNTCILYHSYSHLEASDDHAQRESEGRSERLDAARGPRGRPKQEDPPS